MGLKTAIELLKLKPDIIHFHGFRSINFFPWFFARLTRVPCVITPHFDYNPELFREKVNFFVHKLMSFDKVFAITLGEKDVLESLGFKRIEIIPNSVDINLFKQLPGNNLFFRKKYGIAKKTFLVLFLGRLASNKGIPYLFDAFKGIKTEDKKLVIVGKENPAFPDTRYAYFGSIAKKIGVFDKTIFTKELNEKEVVDTINSTDVLVLPSINSEAFGIALIEAMACSKPVIGSSIGGIKEVIVDGFNGFLVPPKKSDELAIALEMLLDAKLREKMGNNGLKLVKNKYSLAAVSETHVKFYLELIH